MAFESRSSRYAVLLASILFLFGFLCGNRNLCLAYQASELSEEETQQVLAAERFLKVLEKSPRRGTSLERVYRHHVEFGTLDSLIQQLNERIVKNEKDDVAWMLIGLFESERGVDSAAVDAFRQANSLRPEDPLAAYYLGQSLLRTGLASEAIKAYEQALTRNPAREDSLEIFQQLGRIHQRAQRRSEALKVWQRLEDLFPRDPRVLEQIAVTLMEENEYALALPHYQRLAELVKDDYRRVLFRAEAACLKIKTSQRDEGIADLEAILTDLNPESWLFRDMRRRIEDVFLKSGDQDELVEYYQKWLTVHPDDIEAMSRLAQFLASSARVPEAMEWMEKSLKLAPTRADYRKVFINQLIDNHRIPEAIQQYEQLDAISPGNPDYLRDWGKLVLKDKSQEMGLRKQEATRIWNQIVSIRPDDASNLAQVADFFRQANMNEDATSLYMKAIEKAPDEPQYREYLAEFLQNQKRNDEALTVWKSIAEGSRHNAVNLARLAEVYRRFGLYELALVEIVEACRLNPKDFFLQIQAVDYHLQSKKFDEAVNFLAAAEKLAVDEDERDTVIKQRIEVLQASQQLETEIARLVAVVQGNPSASADDWHLLARYQEAERRWSPAMQAIETALKLEPKSIPILSTAARITESSGDFGRAAEMNRMLASVDRRSLGAYLMNVARLEAQIGRSDEALKAASELVVSAPANTDHYEFLAQMYFRLGKRVEGLATLRKAIRINPNEPHLIMALGSALSDQSKTVEAIELYWRAFDKTESLEDKTSLTTKLVGLYQQSGQFEKLIERFELDRRKEEKRRAMTICLAQAYNTAGDTAMARQEMESLLNQETRDTNLLQQLARLCENSGDANAAIDYQRQLVAIAPGAETELPLAKMLQARGDFDEANAIFVRLTSNEQDPVRLLKNIDSLLANSNHDVALSLTEPLLNQDRDNWELLYREGVALAKLEKKEDAKVRFERLLAIDIPHDSLGADAESKYMQSQSKARSDSLRGLLSSAPKRQSPFDMLNSSALVIQAANSYDNTNSSSTSRSPSIWMPDAFGLARMAAYAWLFKLDPLDNVQAPNKPDGVGEKSKTTWMDNLKQQANLPEAKREAVNDWMYVASITSKNADLFEMARRLARAGGQEEQMFFLDLVQRRRALSIANMFSGSVDVEAEKTNLLLSEDDVELMMTCYQALPREKKFSNISGQTANNAIAMQSNLQLAFAGSQIVALGSSGLRTSSSSSLQRNRGSFLETVARELRLAGKEDQANQLLDSFTTDASGTAELALAMNLSFNQKKYQELTDLFARWVAQAQQDIASTAKTSRSPTGAMRDHQIQLSRIANLLMNWMGNLGPEQDHAQILKILDSALDVAVLEAKQRRDLRSMQTQPSKSSSTNTASVRAAIQLYYGTESIQSFIDFPGPNEHLDQTTLGLLREVYEIFNRNHVLQKFPEHLRKRMIQSKPEDRLYAELILAVALWWTDEQDEAIDLMTVSAKSIKDDVSFVFELASMHESRGDVQIAFDLLDSMTPRDQPSIQRKELQVMVLAERIGDRNRAIQAAERLFGFRLDPVSQVVLAASLRRLQLDELADTVEARMRRKPPAPNPTNSQLSQMLAFQQQGKTDEANRVALALLHRSSPTVTAPTTAASSSTASRTSADSVRSQAISVLKKSGELARAAERIEAQLEKSSGTTQLYSQLLEFYKALGELKKAGILLQKIVDERPDDTLFRYYLAKHLTSTGRPNEACDYYIQLFQTKPDWLIVDLASVISDFARAKREQDLEQAIQSIDIKNLKQSSSSINTVLNLTRNNLNPAVTVGIIEKFYEAFPPYRPMLIAQLRDRFLLNHGRIFELAKGLIIPSDPQARMQPWYGLTDFNLRSSNGTISGVFQELFHSSGNLERKAEMRTAIENEVKLNSNWLGGKVMLGIIALSENTSPWIPRSEESPPLVSEENPIDVLIKLFRNEKIVESMPVNAYWIVGQELENFPKTRSIALQLYERAALQTDSRSLLQLESSPLMKLAKLYYAMDRKNDARELIFKYQGTGSANITSNVFADRYRISNQLWAANALLDCGFPMDSIRIYRQLLADPALPKLGASSTVRVAGFTKQELDKSNAKALASITDSNAEDSIAQLLDVRESRGPGSSSIDLMMELPKEEVGGYKKIESGLLNLIDTISKSESISRLVDDRLTHLHTQYPSDLSIGIVLAMTRMKAKSDRTDEALKYLVDWIEAHPLEALPEGKNPNARQRREALLSVPLWMVARQCFTDGNQQEIGQKLGQRALSAARRQPGIQQSASILFEWTDLLTNLGDRPNAEAKLSELLSIAMERPHRKRASLGETSMVDEIPPLTMLQFYLAVEIELRAAKHGMHGLAMKAVRDALISGLPIDLPSSSPTAISGSTRVITSSGSSVILPSLVPPVGSNPNATIGRVYAEDAVLKWVTGILVKWKMQAYTPEVVYEFLESVVMPPSRPTEIRLFVSPYRSTMNSGPRSLAKSLIEWGQTAGKLDELYEACEVRKQNPSSQVAGTVMQALIAISKDDLVKAKLHLEDLAQQSQNGMSRSMLETARLAAYSANSISVLREPAKEILTKTGDAPSF